MSDTIKKQIRTQALALLNDASRPTGTPLAELGRTGDDPVPTISLYQLQGTPRVTFPPAGTLVHRTLTLAVEIRAASDAGDPYDAVEAYEAWVVKALGGFSMAGVLHRIEEGNAKYELDGQLDHTYCIAVVQFHATYQTEINSTDVFA